jgi:hypothetical protein
MKGNSRNISIVYKNGETTLDGSLSKYQLGNNVHNMKREDVERAVESLSNETGIDIGSFNIYQWDIGATFYMDHAASYYFECLDYLPKYHKEVYPGYPYHTETLYFKTKWKTLIFYDKIKDLEKNDQAVLSQIFGQISQVERRYLRYEFRINNKVKRAFGASVIVSDLYNPDFYGSLINLWKEYYDKIRKKKEILEYYGQNIGGLIDLRKALAAKGMEAIGKDTIINILNRRYGANEIEYAPYRRTKMSLDELQSQFGYQSEYLQELNEKIEDEERDQLEHM